MVFCPAQRATFKYSCWSDGIRSSFGFQVYLTRDHLPAKGSIDDIANITMPNTKRGVILEIEVNPSRNKPLNEVTYTNNKIRETIKNLDSDEREQTKESDPYLVK